MPAATQASAAHPGYLCLGPHLALSASEGDRQEVSRPEAGTMAIWAAGLIPGRTLQGLFRLLRIKNLLLGTKGDSF